MLFKSLKGEMSVMNVYSVNLLELIVSLQSFKVKADGRLTCFKLDTSP